MYLWLKKVFFGLLISKIVFLAKTFLGALFTKAIQRNYEILSKPLVPTVSVQYGTLYKTVPADGLAQLSANISHWTAVLLSHSHPSLVGCCRGHWPTRPPRVLVLCCRRVYSDCSAGPPGCVHFEGISLVERCRRNPRACWQLVKELVGRCLHLSGVREYFWVQLNTAKKARQGQLLEPKREKYRRYWSALS